MPFKLRLNKKRQYNVVSKSLFVICVELLDGTSIECTLSAESSGQECLHNVCQRLGLQQPEFFGLRYVARGGSSGMVGSSGNGRQGQTQSHSLRARGMGLQGTMCGNPEAHPLLRWVEMDRPLKRQLDKKARDPCLYLRVMYYVSGVSLLTDEMTRYHYFLQLKMDVIEGRVSVTPKQAVILASYSMQAEFGNHDPERHTAEYLKDFVLFPKHLTECADDGDLAGNWGTPLETLTEAVICHHAALAGLPQGTAEEYYILFAQKQDGYGQETFLAKDESGEFVVIGVTLTGIVVGYENAQSKFYRWRDITNVVINKRCFGIECHSPDETVQFTFEDAAMAKYVWRMCVHQHTFYMHNEQAVESASVVGENGLPFLPQHMNDHGSNEAGHHNQALLQGTPPLHQHPHSLHQSAEEEQLPCSSVMSYLRDDMGLGQRVGSCGGGIVGGSGQGVADDSYPLLQVHQHMQQHLGQQHQQQGHEDVMPWGIPIGVGGAPNSAVQRAQSTSCLDLVTASEADKLRSLLPSYRPAPDYETAMQQKYGSGEGGGGGSGEEICGRGSGGGGGGEGLGRLGSVGDTSAGAILHASHLGLLYSSQPEIHQTHLQDVRGRYGSVVGGHYPKQYPDVTRVMDGIFVGGSGVRGGAGTADPGGDKHLPVSNGALPAPSQVVHTHSTPDLDVVEGHLARGIHQLLHLYKPPPPYPSGAGEGWSGVGGRGVSCQSNSTPDLATATGNIGITQGGHALAAESGLSIIQQRPSFVAMQVSGSSPDLVSSRGSLGAQGYQSANAYSAIMAMSSHQQEQEYQHQYHNQVQRLSQGTLPQQQKQQQYRQAFGGIPEPIYENVPLPWTEGSNVEEGDENHRRKAQTEAGEGGRSGTPLVQMTSANEYGSGRGNISSSNNKEGGVLPVPSAAAIALATPLTGLPPEGGSGAKGKKKRRGVDGSGEKQGRYRKWGGLLAVGRSKSRSKATDAESWEHGNGEEGLGDESVILGSLAMPKESVCQAIEKKLEGGQLFFEFERIPRKRPDAEFTTALLSENVTRNRYPDVLPYEDNRVRLTPSKDNKTGYINASHINVITNPGSSTLGSQRHSHHSRRQHNSQHSQQQRCPYIAAQAPLPETRTHFWRMVWECQVNVVASLTSPNTLPSSGASIPPSTYASYYPTPSAVPGEPKCMEFGEFQVWNEVSRPLEEDGSDRGSGEMRSGSRGCSASRLRLVHVPSRRHRRVWVLSYPHWGEQGCPIGPSHFLGFLEELNSVRQQAALEAADDCGAIGKESSSTTLVLCGAGAGRTGVLLLCDILLYSLDYSQELDVARVLGQLRRQRMHLVQTVAQYRFVHTLLLHYLKHSRLI